MTPHTMARTAYSSPTAAVRTERGTEYEAFAQITREIKQAADRRGDDFPGLAQALHRNRQLWTLLAAGVADGANRLPELLRARIFYLASFTAQQTRLILAGSGNPDILIEVNTAVMQGLRGGTGA